MAQELSSTTCMQEGEFLGKLKFVGGHMAQIVCKETEAKYDRDVTIEKVNVPAGALHHDRVIFRVEADSFGLPQATCCRLAPVKPVVDEGPGKATLLTSRPDTAAKSAQLVTQSPFERALAGFTGLLAKSEGRDKLGRIAQYGGRMLSGIADLQGAQKGSALAEWGAIGAEVQKTLGGARRTHRWGKEIPLIKSLPKTLDLVNRNLLDFFLEVVQKLNQLGYLMFDRLAWLKQQKIITGGKSAAETVKTAMSFFMVCNGAATLIQLKKYCNEKDESKKGAALKAAFKHLLLTYQCAHNSTIFVSHNAYVGAAGVISSIIDVQAQWPAQK